MNLTDRIIALTQRIAAEFKTVFAAIAGKADASHGDHGLATHAASWTTHPRDERNQIEGCYSACDHNHAIADTTDLQTALDDKANDIISGGPVVLGALYNRHAVVDVKGLAADGWKVPLNSNFVTLRSYLDPAGTQTDNVAGGKLKEIGTLFFDAPNTGATNEVGLKGRGTGTRVGPFLSKNKKVLCGVVTPIMLRPVGLQN